MRSGEGALLTGPKPGGLPGGMPAAIAEQRARLLRVLADPSRLRILAWLAVASRICASDLERELDLKQPTVSHHLATLRRAGLVQWSREGAFVHYRLAPDLPPLVEQLLASWAPSEPGRESEIDPAADADPR